MEISECYNFKFKTPLSVSMMNIDNHFYVTNADLCLCADGLNEDEAILNFKKELGLLYTKAQKIIEMVE